MTSVKNYQSALITGAAHGIGEALFHRLKDAGIQRFLLIDKDNKKLEQIAEMQKNNLDIHLFSQDLLDIHLLQKELPKYLKHFGNIDILIHNAGIAIENDPDNIDIWNKVISLNLNTPFCLTALALDYLNDHGRIINISSILGRIGQMKNTAYCASKHGLLGYTKSLALDLAYRKITVNAILPGWVDTPMLRNELNNQAFQLGVTPEQILKNARKKIPIKRFVLAEEVAELAYFLCSDKASAITAQSFVIDGGFTCGM